MRPQLVSTTAASTSETSAMATAVSGDGGMAGAAPGENDGVFGAAADGGNSGVATASATDTNTKGERERYGLCGWGDRGSSGQLEARVRVRAALARWRRRPRRRPAKAPQQVSAIGGEGEASAYGAGATGGDSAGVRNAATKATADQHDRGGGESAYLTAQAGQAGIGYDGANGGKAASISLDNQASASSAGGLESVDCSERDRRNRRRYGRRRRRAARSRRLGDVDIEHYGFDQLQRHLDGSSDWRSHGGSVNAGKERRRGGSATATNVTTAKVGAVDAEADRRRPNGRRRRWIQNSAAGAKGGGGVASVTATKSDSATADADGLAQTAGGNGGTRRPAPD